MPSGASAREIHQRLKPLSGVFATLGLQLERVRAVQARGARVEVWFQDEARIGQKNTLTRVWGQTGSRPAAPKDLGFASAYGVWCGLPVAGQGGGADHADLQYRRDEPSPLRDQQPSRC